MSETNIIDCRFVKSDAEIINELKQQLAECQAELQKVTEQKNAMWFSLAECQATNGRLRNSDAAKLLLEAYDFGQFADDFNHSQAKPVRAAIRKVCEALALPNDATALNELIAEAKEQGKSEALEQVRHFVSVRDERDKLAERTASLTAEVERLKAECAAFASNLRGKQATTGATYQHLIQQNAELTAQINNLKAQIAHLEYQYRP